MSYVFKFVFIVLVSLTLYTVEPVPIWSCNGTGESPFDQPGSLKDCQKKTGDEKIICEYDLRVANKKFVKNFYQTVFGSKKLDRATIDSFMEGDPEFLQHNPCLGDGVEAFANAVPLFFTNAKLVEDVLFHIVVADEDKVYIYLKGDVFKPFLALTDIYRLSPKSKITEHWDTAEVTTGVPADRRRHPFFADKSPDGEMLTDGADSATKIAEYHKKENNKMVVKEFHESALGQLNPALVDQHLAEEYIEHHPTMPDGKKNFVEHVENKEKVGIKLKIDYINIGGEGDFVFIHTRATRRVEISMVDIYRLKEEKITEHWVIEQNTASAAPFNCTKLDKHPHPFF